MAGWKVGHPPQVLKQRLSGSTPPAPGVRPFARRRSADARRARLNRLGQGGDQADRRLTPRRGGCGGGAVGSDAAPRCLREGRDGPPFSQPYDQGAE